MEQLSFFADTGQSPGLPKSLMEYHPGLFNDKESDMRLRKFIAECPWQQKIVKMYDKEVVTPRLTSWYADEETYGIRVFHTMFVGLNTSLFVKPTSFEPSNK